MKKIFTLVSVMALYFSAISQTVVPNASFETWNTHNSILYPDKWEYDSFEVDNGFTKRVSPGSAGSYAIQLGSYDDGGIVYGTFIEVYDTVIGKPGSLSFDYKIFNAPGFLNGLYIQIYFYNDTDYIRDFAFTAVNNSSTFKTGTLNIGFLAGEKPTHYRLEVSYANLGSDLTEYTIVDNFRFGASASVANTESASAIKIWPNPTSTVLNISNLDLYNIKDVRLTSIDGRSIDIVMNNSRIDISSLNSGVYFLEIIDNNNTMIRREKIAITN